MIGHLGEAPKNTIMVSTVEDVDQLELPDPEKVCYLTQTTLSLDETRDIVEGLRERFPGSRGRSRRTSATRPRTGSWR